MIAGVMRPNLVTSAGPPGGRAGRASPAPDYARMARTVAAVVCETGPEFPCPYLPGREARFSGIDCENVLPAGLYDALMQANFRRNGTVIYRPACPSCDRCRMARIPVAEFQPDRAQRRCARANADLSVTAGFSVATAEKHDLYRRYLAARHSPGSRGLREDVEAMTGSWEEFTNFLTATCVKTADLEFRNGEGRLLAVSVVDVEPDSLSAVYCYFDPAEARRSLGTFNVLTLVDEARRRGLSYVYLGYWIDGAPKMSYKSRFDRLQVLSGAPEEPAAFVTLAEKKVT